jgi:peptidoglycan/xylan/chitin deacetylase (PgdA/CDA1 family)
MKIKNASKLIALLAAISLILSFLCACSNPIEEESSPETTADIQASVEPKKRVALTFDDGPHNVRTVKIVDELAKYGFNATFFVVGNRIDGTSYNGSAGLKYTAEKGNEIAIHGYTHSSKNYYDKCDDATYKFELSEPEKAIKSGVKNASIRLMRPVGGRITDSRIQTSKYSVIMWSVDSEDWAYKYSSSDTDAEAAQKVNTIVNNVMSSVRDRSIILMHDIYESTYDAVVIILQKLHEQGYEVVTVSELLGENLAAGRQYYDAE